jgi:hypothetical protein
MSIVNSCAMHKEDKFSTGDIHNYYNTIVNPLIPEQLDPAKLSNSYLRSSIDAINFYHDTYPNQLHKLKLWTPECHTAFHAIEPCYSRMDFCNMIIQFTSIVMRVTFSLVLLYSPMECLLHIILVRLQNHTQLLQHIQTP